MFMLDFDIGFNDSFLFKRLLIAITIVQQNKNLSS